jgi:hypothetical protein
MAMRALISGCVYFGTFLALGYVGKRLLDAWMARHGMDLRIQSQDRGGGHVQRFLLGAWYKD